MKLKWLCSFAEYGESEGSWNWVCDVYVQWVFHSVSLEGGLSYHLNNLTNKGGVTRESQLARRQQNIKERSLFFQQ